MSLKDLDRGDKTDIHLRLYNRELEILDILAARYNTSRVSIVGALIKDYVDNDEPELVVREGAEPGAPSRRR